jgi:hypothetical protein
MYDIFFSHAPCAYTHARFVRIFSLRVYCIVLRVYTLSCSTSETNGELQKQRTKTLVSAVENIGSFSYSLSQLITQMVDHETFMRDPARGRYTLRDEVHAVQCILSLSLLCLSLVSLSCVSLLCLSLVSLS